MKTSPFSSRLMVLMFTDIVGSVDLKRRFGDAVAGDLIAAHDRLFRSLIDSIEEAEMLKDTGDGFLARFPTTSEAVRAGLRFQQALHVRGEETQQPIYVRIGIHLGEVSELDEESTGLAKVSGLAVDLAARVMGLALPAQTLMSRAAFDNARQYVREHPPGDNGKPAPELRWVAHGPYQFHGQDEPMDVFEVGGTGIAPLRVPPDYDKARRVVEADDEETLGWRPAIGLPIPGRLGWTLERRLGEGGFGEVWLGTNQRTGSHRVFKFCYDADRLRSFKRELSLLRILREGLGERGDIARLYEVRLDEPPFYLESEYTEHGSLLDWANEVGGISKLDLATRLNLVAAIADAVAAAHSVGVLHKDIKPANILIFEHADGSPRPCLSDFGIGTIDKATASESNTQRAGFTSSIDAALPGLTGTAIYSPPEVLAGRMFTVQGDVYALGVLLYQMVVGDLERPLAQGWERDIEHPLLREDIAACVEGHESERLGSAKELAERLRTLPQRRRQRVRKRVARFSLIAAAGLTLLLFGAGFLVVRERTLRNRAETALERMALSFDFFITSMAEAADPTAQRGGDTPAHETTIFTLLSSMTAKAAKHFEEYPDLEAEALQKVGTTLKEFSLYDDAERTLQRALEIRREVFPAGHELIAQSMMDLADVWWFQRNYADSKKLYEESLEMQRKANPGDTAEIAAHLNGLAMCINSMGQSKEAEPMLLEALRIRELLYENDPKSIDPMLIAASQNNLGHCLRRQQRYEEAIERFNAAIALAETVLGSPHFYLARAHHNLAMVYRNVDRVEDAEEEYKIALAMKAATLRADHSSIADTELDFAHFLFDQRRLEDALKHAEHALGIVRSAYRAGSEPVARALLLLSEIQLASGDAPSAATNMAEVVSIREADYHERMSIAAERGSQPPSPVLLALSRDFYAKCLLANDNAEAAEPLLVDALQVLRAELGDEHRLTQGCLDQLIQTYTALNEQERAEEYRRLLTSKVE